MTEGKPRAPGRPSDTDRQEARRTLIETAATLFAGQGYDGTSLKQVADGAGVTPAMVAYYFKDKSGLLEAVVRRGLGILLEVVETVVADHVPGEFVPELIDGYLGTLSRHPWIPQILIREVVSKDTPLRALFMEEFAQRAATLVPARVESEMREGALRPDLDARYTILSLVGMCVFPFVAQPVLGPLLGYRLDTSFGESYTAHVLTLFSRGAGVGS
jgi:AcrR family transcriptional regulator